MAISAVSHQVCAAQRAAGTRVPTYIFSSNRDLARSVARTIAAVIRERNSFGQNAVLGLPTGSTPTGVYRELVRMHRDEGLDFSGVVTFNIDEYYGLHPEQMQSYHYTMRRALFDHVNIPPGNIHIPDGTVPLERIEAYCRHYEDLIERAGGIDLMLLGIGRDGHIGFNEPYTSRSSRTQLVTLDPVTRTDAASDFFGKENVPTQAITMGVGTIYEARKIILIAMGEHKARIVRETVEGPVTERIPATLLRDHPDLSILIDDGASEKLTCVATPWQLRNVEWTDDVVKRAVLWLCEKTGKSLLKLDGEDFREHGLHQLLREQGPAEKISHRVFRWMMDTINYHPAGRERKRVLCFSPHPDDDVISMGGTLIRLVEDGHDVHIAYMTSGNIAVFDHDAQRVADLVTEFNRLFQIDNERSVEVERRVMEALANKAPGQPDSDDVLKIKALIRWSEAKAAAKACGCPEENLAFLDLPFYRTGMIAKNPVGSEDVRLVRELIERLQPDQIYLAGDLSDPHGTHRVCAEAILAALGEIEEAAGELPEVLLYRGAWQEWPAHQIEIAVPLSPRDLERKKAAIFRHESQKDSALFPGSDRREFWQRAEDRNRHTADLYNQLGLPEYYAMEAFVRWDGVPL
jgi:glucosamine-6-phosphate deaminase